MAEFMLVKEVAGKVPVYQGKKAATGEVVEFNEFFSAKAEANPDFESVIEAEIEDKNTDS